MVSGRTASVGLSRTLVFSDDADELLADTVAFLYYSCAQVRRDTLFCGCGYLGSTVTYDVRCTFGIESGITAAKATFNKKNTL